jgi:hypothetical protein
LQNRMFSLRRIKSPVRDKSVGRAHLTFADLQTLTFAASDDRHDKIAKAVGGQLTQQKLQRNWQEMNNFSARRPTRLSFVDGRGGSKTGRMSPAERLKR